MRKKRLSRELGKMRSSFGCRALARFGVVLLSTNMLSIGISILSLSAVADLHAETVTVSRVGEFAYNPPRRWIPPEEDKAGYWHQVDYGVIELMDLDLQSQTVAVVTKARQPDGYRLITLDLDRRAIRRNRIILDQFGASVEDMALSPDAQRIAVTEGKAARFVIRNAATFSELGRAATDGTVNALAWSPDGRRLAVTDKTSVEIWPSEPPLERQKFVRGVRSFEGAGWIMDVAWSPDGNYLGIGTNEPAVYIHNLTAGSQGPSLLPKPGGAVTQMEWSPDGEFLAVRVQGHNGDINIWQHPKRASGSLGGESYRHVAQLMAAANGQNFGPMAIGPKSRAIVFPNKRGELLFYSLQTGSRIKTQRAHEGSVAGVAWQADTLLTYAMYPDRKFVRWRVDMKE